MIESRQTRHSPMPSPWSAPTRPFLQVCDECSFKRPAVACVKSLKLAADLLWTSTQIFLLSTSAERLDQAFQYLSVVIRRPEYQPLLSSAEKAERCSRIPKNKARLHQWSGAQDAATMWPAQTRTPPRMPPRLVPRLGPMDPKCSDAAKDAFDATYCRGNAPEPLRDQRDTPPPVSDPRNRTTRRSAAAAPAPPPSRRSLSR